MTIQRRRGQRVTLYPEIEVTNGDGDKVLQADTENGVRVKAVLDPERGSHAELHGQQEISTYTLIVTTHLPIEIGTWSKCMWNGYLWDVIEPPQYRHGPRRVKHFELNIRKLPDQETP